MSKDRENKSSGMNYIKNHISCPLSKEDYISEEEKTNMIRKGRKMVAAAIILVLLLTCTVTLGRPFAAGAGIIKEEDIVSFRIVNPTFFPVTWSCLLFDGSGKPISDEYLPAFEGAIKPIMRFGTITQKVRLAGPVSEGDYMLQVVFRYDAWESQQERASELQFKSES